MSAPSGDGGDDATIAAAATTSGCSAGRVYLTETTATPARRSPSPRARRSVFTLIAVAVVVIIVRKAPPAVLPPAGPWRWPSCSAARSATWSTGSSASRGSCRARWSTSCRSSAVRRVFPVFNVADSAITFGGDARRAAGPEGHRLRRHGATAPLIRGEHARRRLKGRRPGAARPRRPHASQWGIVTQQSRPRHLRRTGPCRCPTGWRGSGVDGAVPPVRLVPHGPPSWPRPARCVLDGAAAASPTGSPPAPGWRSSCRAAREPVGRRSRSRA